MNGEAASQRAEPPKAGKNAAKTAAAATQRNEANHSSTRWTPKPDGQPGGWTANRKALTASTLAKGKGAGRYAGIQSVVDSGSSVTNYAKRMASKDGRKKDGELFSRMKPLTFARMLLEASMSHDLAALESRALQCSTTTHRYPGTRPPSPRRVAPGSAAKPAPPGHVNDVLIGKGTGGDAPVAYDDPPASTAGQAAGADMLPYFLMDARSPDEWAKGHLVGACCYPATVRTRASGPIASRELMAYCNNDNKIIVVYDEGEREAPLLAQSLAERGVTNCYLLSGGLEAIIAKGIQGIYVGDLPESCRNLPAGPAKSGALSAAAATATRTYSAYGLSGYRTTSGLKNGHRSGATSGKLGGRRPSAGAEGAPEPTTSAKSSRLDLGALRECLNNVTPTASIVSIRSPVA